MAANRRGSAYRHLLMHLPVAVLVVRDGVIRFANRAAAGLLATGSARALVGAEYDDFVLSMTPAVAGQGERLKLRRADGKVTEAAVEVATRGRSRIVVLGGASRPHASEAEVQQAQRMEAVGRLASGIAHDFNNLLTAIHGHAQFLLEDMTLDNPSRTDATEIMRSAERATALTRQLLSFSRAKAIQPEIVDLNRIITSMQTLLRRVISANIELVTLLDSGLARVRVDAGQIEQILVNLIVNARDAMPDGGTITIKTANATLGGAYAATAEEVEPGEYAMLAVSDTGIGMERDVQLHAFEPFFTTKAQGHGTGLGLSTVYSIVKQMGGHVFLYSEPGHGTVFKVYLPVATPRVRAGGGEGGGEGEGEVVLVVEDDAGVRALARRILQARGYRVVLAESGESALATVGAAEPVAVALIDHMLPDTSGAELAEKIRAEREDCQLIIMSGYSVADIRRFGALPAGAHFIEKPFTPADLVTTVRAALDAAVA